MKPARLLFHVRFWILIAAISGAGFVVFNGAHDRFVTDISKLLPAADSLQEDAQLLAEFREREEGLLLGALIFSGNESIHDRQIAANRFRDELLASGVFEKAALGRGSSSSRDLFETIYNARFTLLLPLWAKRAGISEIETDPSIWANAIVDSLDDFLNQTEATVAAELLPADPFPLVGYLVDSAPYAFDESPKPFTHLFWAFQKGSPYQSEDQQAVFKALQSAAAVARETAPDLEMLSTSIAKFAAESEKQIRSEITRINLLSLFLVALVAFIFLRQNGGLIHLAIIVILAVTGATAGVLLLFPSVHILTLVVGGLLVGVAIDYGIHVLLHSPSDPHADYAQVLREVRIPLLASGLSTAAGFAALFFTDLPLLRQIGAFVSCGLLSALAACWLYLPLRKRKPQPPSNQKTERAKPLSPILFLFAGLLLLLPLAGWLRLDWHDDLRKLQPAMPQLFENDAAVRTLFSGEISNVAWLCHGKTLREAREKLTEFEDRWTEAGGTPEELTSLAPWIADPRPSETVRETFLKMEGFKKALTEQLELASFDAKAFSPFFDLLNHWLSRNYPSYDMHLAEVADTLDGPGGLLMRDGKNHAFFLVAAPRNAIPAGWEPPPGIIAAEQLESLNELFSLYRTTAWQVSGISLGAIIIGVFLVYRRSAIAVLIIPILATAWGIGLLSVIQSPLNLFHLLGGFLGFCIALDYGAFFQLSRDRIATVPRSIRASAATTLAAFAILGIAKIPALAALGQSVFLVVAGGLLLIELSHRWKLRKSE